MIVLCLPVPHRMDGLLPQQQYLPLGVSHQNGRVGGNQQLGASTHQPVNFRQQSQLPGGGEGRFGFVQQVDALSPEPVVHQAEKALPVGLVVQRLAAVVPVKLLRGRREAPLGEFFHLCGGVVKALRPEEKPVLGAVEAPVEPQVVM